ncbi:MAG: hypothetical protein JRI61_11260 [Deltaproteobacteria bacterium]|nr:hypothetical protein [Deltaproteobacteria bacterium]
MTISCQENTQKKWHEIDYGVHTFLETDEAFVVVPGRYRPRDFLPLKFIYLRFPIDPIWELLYIRKNMEVSDMENTVLRIDDEFQEIGTKTIDDRNRLTLGDLFRGYKRVRLYKNERGELFLQPTVEIPASELWLFQNREALKAVQTGLKDASEGKIVKADIDKL